MADAQAQAENGPRPGGLARGTAILALWGAVVGVLVVVTAIAVAVVDDLSAAPPWHDPGGDASSLEALAGLEELTEDGADRALRIAGSGSNIPLTRELAEAFMRRRPGERVIVFESVGSTGGVRAASDDVVDLGMISRPLRPAEESLGLVVLPYAHVAVAAVANLDVGDDALTSDELIAIYAGERRQWSDGAAIVVLQRERGDSSHAAVDAVLPAFAEVNERAYREERWRVLYNDRAMHEALVSTPGAIGLLDVGVTKVRALALKVLTLDGVRPTEADVRSGRYPFTKELAFVSGDQPTGLARDFLDFVRSSDGQALIRQQGYIPEVPPGRGGGR
ncbi:MAG: substrate-binding domain-containing protein [Myxococcales bacterium]|nr:substrate-binding domain-containing protein [Myxococcales bacterium]